MIGGINGGLGLFEPSADTYTDMMEELKHWRPHTKMAEQEFLSWHWARDGSLNTMHKKYTYQIHQLYFSTPTGTTAGETPSSFSSMVDHPDEIRVFHFSANQKPSMILIDEVTSVEGWLKMEEHLTAHSQFMMKEHGARNEKLKDHPDWINKIDRLMRDAHVEWLEAWKRRYVNVVNYVFKTAYSKMMRKIKYEGEHLRCPSCGEKWHASETEKNSNLIRDHLMFNCDKMAAKIKIPVKHQTNLTTFFFPPCGVQVESKMLYLAEVFKYYDVMDKSRKSNLIEAWNNDKDRSGFAAAPRHPSHRLRFLQMRTD